MKWFFISLYLLLSVQFVLAKPVIVIGPKGPTRCIPIPGTNICRHTGVINESFR